MFIKRRKYKPSRYLARRTFSDRSFFLFEIEKENSEKKRGRKHNFAENIAEGRTMENEKKEKEKKRNRLSKVRRPSKLNLSKLYRRVMRHLTMDVWSFSGRRAKMVNGIRIERDKER